jgi:hypothetical protein
MEEVVGSIPTRSTKSLNNLDRASVQTQRFCVTVCVITLGSGPVCLRTSREGMERKRPSNGTRRGQARHAAATSAEERSDDVRGDRIGRATEYSCLVHLWPLINAVAGATSALVDLVLESMHCGFFQGLQFCEG